MAVRDQATGVNSGKAIPPPMLRMALLRWLAVAACCCLLPLACQRTQAPAAAPRPHVVTLGNQGGAPQAAHEPERPAPPPADYLSGTHWPPAELGAG